MALTSGQQERLRRLLEDELRKAGRTALEDGASPGELADLLAERRHALTEAQPGRAPTEAEPRGALTETKPGCPPTEAEPRGAATDAGRGRTPTGAEHRSTPVEAGPGRPDDRPRPADDVESRPGQT